MRNLNKNLSGKCGIYIITNVYNGKRYIGSTKDLYERLKHHKWDLNQNSHPNNHLQNAWNKYAENKFEYGILEFCSEENRLQREEYYINCLNPEYNLNGIDSNSVLKHSEKTKEKISDSIKECYISGKLDSIPCYIYSIKDWSLIKECISVNEASEYLGMKSSVRSNIIEHRLFKNKFIVRLNKFESKLDLINEVSKYILTYQSKNSSSAKKYLIGEKDGIRTYFRTTSDVVKKYGVSSVSTIKKHCNATINNPYIIRNTNIKIYWSDEYIPYDNEPSL